MRSRKFPLFLVLFLVILVAFIGESHAVINLTTTTGYQWTQDDRIFKQEHFCETKDYYVFAYAFLKSVKTVVFLKSEGIYRYQTLTTGDAVIDGYNYLGVSICTFNYSANTVLIVGGVFETYPQADLGITFYMKYNAQTGALTCGSGSNNNGLNSFNGISQAQLGSNGNFYWSCSMNISTLYLYVWQLTPALSLTKVKTSTQSYCGSLHGFYDSAVSTYEMFFLMATTTNYFALYTYNFNTNTLSFIVLSGSPQDATYLSTTEIQLALYQTNTSEILLMWKSHYKNVPTYAFECKGYAFNITGATSSLWYAGGFSYFAGANIRTAYGIGAFLDTGVEVYAINTQNIIESFTFVFQNVPNNPTVTSYNEVNTGETNLASANLLYAFKYFGKYKIEITNTGDMYYTSQNLYAGTYAGYTGTLISPSSNNVLTNTLYVIDLKIVSGSIPIANEPVIQTRLEPDNSLGSVTLITNSSGDAVCYYTFFKEGTYKFTWELFILQKSVYNQTVYFVATSSGIPPLTPPNTNPSISSAQMIYYLTPLLLMFAPALIFASEAGKDGFIVGLIIGSFACYIAGFTPFWFIAVMGITISYLFLSRHSRGG